MMVGLPLAPADWLNDLLPAVAYTVYPMTGEPPSMAGGVKVIVAWFGPLATADTAVGAFGATIIGVIDTMGVVPGAGTMESAVPASTTLDPAPPPPPPPPAPSPPPPPPNQPPPPPPPPSKNDSLLDTGCVRTPPLPPASALPFCPESLPPPPPLPPAVVVAPPAPLP